MVTENKKRIIEYLYQNNHRNPQSSVPIEIIHSALGITAEDFNAALSLLLSENEKKVEQTNNKRLYITPVGMDWYEQNVLNEIPKPLIIENRVDSENKVEFTIYEKKSLKTGNRANIIAVIAIIVTIIGIIVAVILSQ